MSGDISLYDLVNLSIGSPEAGAVNFNALHTLLHAILGHLKIQDVTTNWKAGDSLQTEPDDQPQTTSRGERCGPYHHMEEKLRQIEKQIAMIENLPTGTDLLERTSSTTTPVNDMWQLMQVRCKIQTNGDGVSKAMELIQDQLKEIQDLKEFRDSLKNEVKSLKQQLEQMNIGGLAERVTVVENCCHRVDELEAAARTLKERVLQYPEPEDLDQCVTWDVMHSALLSEREQLHQELAASGSIDPTSHFRAPGSPLVPAKALVPGSQSTPGKPLTSPRPSAPLKPSTQPTPSAPHSPDQGAAAFTIAYQRDKTLPTQGKKALTVAYQQEETSPTQGEVPPETGAPPGRVPLSSPSLPQQTSSDTGLETIGIPLSRVASITERYPETVEALRNLGRLRKRHDHLEARVTTLEASKVDQAQLALLRELITNMDARDVPDNLMDQLNHLRALVDSLMSDREKLDNLEEMFMNLGSAKQESTSEEAPETVDSENVGSRQLKVQISYLRTVVQKLEEDMKELKGRGALSGQKTTDNVQDQLDNLEEMFMNLGSAKQESTSEEAPESVDSENVGSRQLKVQISYLRTVVQKLEEDMKELKGRGALSGQKTTDNLQDQLDNLEEMFMNLGSAKQESTSEEAPVTVDSENVGSRQLKVQISYLRTVVQKLEEDMKELKGRGALSGQKTTEKLQDQLDNLEEMFMNLGSAKQESTSEEAPETVDSENVGSRQLKVQISYLRTVVQKLEEDMKELKGRGALSGQKTTDNVQDQLDHLRDMLEDTMASSSSVLSRSLQEETGQEDHSDSQGFGQGQGQEETGQEEHSDSQGFGQGQGQGQEDAEFTTCMVDIGRKISLLLLRYEQLQNTVNGILKQHTTGGKAENTELINDVQNAILQLQAECERLHDKTSHLAEDNSQKQSHIQQLYKTVAELEEKKADKQLLEMEIEIKADKCALDSKVSRMQFDTMTEQLNAMFHELLTKVTGQEEDWHKVIDKLSTEMECKLNRIELESVKKQLEDRWKNIRKRLQDQPAPEHADAAGIRRQLVARFHCISCDRPVSMQASGPHLVTVPSAPGLPSHKSSRPYTVYELEQVRQHCRRPGNNLSNFEMVNTERSMSRQIAQVQRQLNHFEAMHIQGSIKETQARFPLILSPLPKISHSRPKLERIPEMADYSYLAMSRRCGGSHTTVTYPNRRYTRLQHITHYLQAEVEGQPLSPSQLRFQPEEVDILGLDGHIYKGRLNSRSIRTVDARLPTISPKEGMCKSRDKVMRCQSQRSGGLPEPGHAMPVRPQSAKTQRSRSTSSSSVRDRPVSVLGCMSQGLLPQGSPQADTNGELQAGTELHVDLGQEEEPVNTL